MIYIRKRRFFSAKDYLLFQGINNLTDLRDTIREVFQANLIHNGDIWMDMLESRNRTSLIYNQETTREISMSIRANYFELFMQLKSTFEILQKQI